MIRTRHVVAALAALFALVGCGGHGESAPPPASGLQTSVGDGIVAVSFTDDLAVNWWLFVSTDPRLTTENFTTLTDIRVIRGARSPSVLCGYPNGGTLYFALNGRIDGGPGGQGTPTVTATPRAAGGSWTAGTAPANDLNAIGHAPLTSCVAAALPSGIFVAVGPAATIVRSTDHVTFTAQSAPTGFTTDLNAVAGYTPNLNNPTDPGTKIVAVGAGGASITSADGIAWEIGVPFVATNAGLNAIAVFAAKFLAVGDAGTALTTADGVTWTTATSNTTANLRGIGCSGVGCVAVGDGGTIARTLDAGATWEVQTITGTPALKRIAYGNFNNNKGALTTALNTWVAVGDGGTILYSLDGAATWTATTAAGAGDFVGVAYTTRFVAVDSAGNSFSSVDGQTWSGPVPTGQTGLRAMVGTGFGYVAVGAGGGNASSF